MRTRITVRKKQDEGDIMAEEVDAAVCPLSSCVFVWTLDNALPSAEA